MDQANDRQSVSGDGGQPMRRMTRIPALTCLAITDDGKLFPVPNGDPRVIGFTPEELLLELAPGVSEDDAMDWRLG